MKLQHLILIAVAVVACAAVAGAETTLLEPVRDTTLYESNDGAVSNGAGDDAFAGRTNQGALRREVIAFDVAGAIPAGATVTAVELSMWMSKSISGATDVGLYRLTADWGESGSDATLGGGGQGAPSQPGDATWVHAFWPDQMWAAAGGDFAPAVSATAAVDAVGGYAWGSTAELVADVQGWLDDPTTEHGWILIADESGGITAKRFNTREHADVATRPVLTVTYTVPAGPPVASFEFTPEMALPDEEIQFTDTSSGAPTTWAWDFGDGSSTSEQNPSHAFADEGSYSVALTVTNDSGSDSASAVIDVVRGDPGPPPTFIAAAASAPGAEGSFFRTLVEVNNAGSGAAAFRLFWLSRDNDNSAPAVSSDMFTLAPGETMRFPDVVGETFGLTDAVGAIMIDTDSFDVVATSRTFNESDAGTFGQSLPGISQLDLIGPDHKVRVLLMTENDAFRANLGVLNGTDQPITVRYERFDMQGSSLGSGAIDLAPYDNTQRNRLFRNVAPIEGGYVDVWTETPGALFTCYGSVLDNQTSDPTTVLPQ